MEIGQKLHELRMNFVWGWLEGDVRQLFNDIDKILSRATQDGLLKTPLSTQDLEKIAHNWSLSNRIDSAYNTLSTYLREPSWFERKYPGSRGQIAYFCTEFGIDASLPIYSGGLGALAGDHLKEASDLGLPMVAVGLYYTQGYFNQRINEFGEQVADYPQNKTSSMAMELVTREDGTPIIISVNAGNRPIHARAYRVKVGRMLLYLLDANISENDPIDQTLTHRLYCSDRTRRLEQEILLGVGGWKLLHTLGHNITFLHLNEGHSVFAALEWIRETMVSKEMDFDTARKHLTSHILFTTHTPVLAGNETFDEGLVANHLNGLANDLGLTIEQFLNLGHGGPQELKGFCLSVVALHISGHANGVSRLHGKVSRRMWHCLYPDVNVNEVPIEHITNGVHYATWLAPSLRKLYRTYLGGDIDYEIDMKERWNTEKIPDPELWSCHFELKRRLIRELRRRKNQWFLREGAPRSQIENIDIFMDPHALTIGFARRFTGYKRAMLIFSDIHRLKRILGHARRPVQIVMAGKSHPADTVGRDFIKEINAISNSKDFRGKVYLVEGYDLELASYIVQGVDVWLNTPTKPHEASGTSGQKAAINGILNLSILDGWWDEGFAGENGWGVEEEKDQPQEHIADRIYSLLETEVVPLYYDARESTGFPVKWVARMKRTIASVVPQFTTRRMLKEYSERYYAPAMRE